MVLLLPFCALSGEMSSICFTSYTTLFPSPPLQMIALLKPNQKPNLGLHFPLNSCYSKPNSRSSALTCSLPIGFDDIAAIAQNKVLIAAGVSAAIGQISKPFTSVLLYGNSLDFRAVVQAGGFPSTHSSAVVATATSLALERGFSDSIFGMSAVYAALIMYDAQGVRREVGVHAKVLNRLLLEHRMKSITQGDGPKDIIDSSVQVKPSSTTNMKGEQADEPLILESRLQKITTTKELKRSSSESNVGNSALSYSYPILKEAVGHTEFEVIAGALLGFLVSLTVYAVL